ncbi:hypothetical protein [Streptococcus ruminantium]|uniref:hypothetical protein n=1 Tax=Streptococcus ruminantium TaxID=1917441 RepID=UPI0012DFE03F|nr:hypothetical protein [Streptococcus ruminantium]
MNKIEMISFSILLDEVAEVRQLLENLVSFDKVVYPELSIGIIPFTSSLGDGILKFLPNDVHSDFPQIGDQEFQKIISSVRVGYKLYSDKKLSKANKLTINIEKLFYSQIVENYHLLQKLVINIFGQQDLGVYYFNGIPYANTNQYHIYLESIFSKTNKKKIPYFDKRSIGFLIEYSKALGTLINSVNQKTINKPIIQDVKIENFEQRDYFILNRKKRNFLTGNLPLETQLFLFNILCQNNFVIHIIPDVLKSKNYFFTRSLIQCYLVSITALRLILDKNSSIISDSQMEQIIFTINRKEKVFNLGQNFRNNIFHYKISNVPLQTFTNPNKFFEELIEFYSSKEINEYQNLLLLEVSKINDLINSLINENQDSFQKI